MRILTIIFLILSLAACSEKETSAIESKQSDLIATRALPNVVLAASSVTATSSNVTALPATTEIASSAVSENHSTNIQRDTFQSIIEKQFPGFRILKAEDFDESARSYVKDGVSGALVIGDFDFDKHKDFAAMLIGNMIDTYKNASRSYNVYDGKLVICHGNAKGDGYLCEEGGKTVYYGLAYSMLSIVPPGRHECEYNEGAKEIVTSIDGIGEYSEKAGGFIVMQKDGTYFSCTDSD